MTENLEITKHQNTGINYILDWFLNNRKEKKPTIFRLFGYAGTGKSTVISILIDILKKNKIQNIATASFTWKAVNVLKDKGVKNCTSIHGLIYYVMEDDNGGVKFVKRKKSDFKLIDLIIIDECSMVHSVMRKQIKSFGVPVLYVGDVLQLPPIEKDDDDLDFFSNPDYYLKEIIRQKDNNSIIEHSIKLRNFERLKEGNYGNLIVKRKNELTNDELLNSEIVLCGTNKRRKRLNAYKRKIMGINPHNYPEIGELLMCHTNSRSLSLFNSDILVNQSDHIKDYNLEEYGKQFDILAKYNKNANILLQDNNTKYRMCYYDYEGNEEVVEDRDDLKWSFAYVTTVHKAQGSEWDTGIILDESDYWISEGNEEGKFRWLYTAVTRFKKSVIILI